MMTRIGNGNKNFPVLLKFCAFFAPLLTHESRRQANGLSIPTWNVFRYSVHSEILIPSYCRRVGVRVHQKIISQNYVCLHGGIHFQKCCHHFKQQWKKQKTMGRTCFHMLKHSTDLLSVLTQFAMCFRNLAPAESILDSHPNALAPVRALDRIRICLFAASLCIWRLLYTLHPLPSSSFPAQRGPES